jgi:hypothetical protein
MSQRIITHPRTAERVAFFLLSGPECCPFS